MTHAVLVFAVALRALPLLLPLSPSAATANVQERCATVPVDVVGASQEELGMACSGAEMAMQRLGQCGLAARRPLQIHIEREVRHPFGGPVFALFEFKQQRILVTRLSSIPELAKRAAYRNVPPIELYRSLMVHEVVHAVLHQSAAGRMMSQIASEYLAHALQIASLPPDSRAAFLQSLPVLVRADDLLFSDIMLSLNPFLFAGRAYQHLEASSDECRQVRALLEGSASFIASSKDLM